MIVCWRRLASFYVSEYACHVTTGSKNAFMSLSNSRLGAYWLIKTVAHLVRASPSDMCRAVRHRFEPRLTHYLLITLLFTMIVNLPFLYFSHLHRLRRCANN